MNILTVYSVRVEGYLDYAWVEWFDGLTIVHAPNGDTILTGPVRDQAALYGLLNRLGDLGLTLIAVSREASAAHTVEPLQS